jgi:hypothetical protein
MVTGKVDSDSIVSIKELETLLNDLWPNYTPTITQCTHIFPKSTNSGISGTAPPELQKVGSCIRIPIIETLTLAKLDCAASFWAILEHFGYSGISQELNGDRVNQLSNVMTLDILVHDWMDKLSLWFEKATDGVCHLLLGIQV